MNAESPKNEPQGGGSSPSKFKNFTRKFWHFCEAVIIDVIAIWIATEMLQIHH